MHADFEDAERRMLGEIDHRMPRRAPTAAVEPGALPGEISIGCPGERGDAVCDSSKQPLDTTGADVGVEQIKWTVLGER